MNWFFLSRSICMITNNLNFNFFLLFFLLFYFLSSCIVILEGSFHFRWFHRSIIFLHFSIIENQFRFNSLVRYTFRFFILPVELHGLNALDIAVFLNIFLSEVTLILFLVSKKNTFFIVSINTRKFRLYFRDMIDFELVIL